MFDKMKELMEMKKQADGIKKTLDKEIVEISDVRGIKIVVNGAQIIQSLEIEEVYYENNKRERLEKDMMRAFNTAIGKSQKIAAKKMQGMMPGM
ncbi:MAG: DNA-binding protein YbaB [Candidatus Omnitrophota bacterium]|jgi:DNA-binding protein YbaB